MRLVIPKELTDLNSYLKAMNNNRFVGAKVKKQDTEYVYWCCKQQKIPPVKDYPVKILFRWFSKDNRKDIDNVAFSKKFILDGLVIAKVLENDSRKFVSGFTDEFYVDAKNPRVEIEIYGK